jgi:hypothetical protein
LEVERRLWLCFEMTRLGCHAALHPVRPRRYQKLQGRLKEEKRAAKLLRAQLAEERAIAAGAPPLRPPPPLARLLSPCSSAAMHEAGHLPTLPHVHVLGVAPLAEAALERRSLPCLVGLDLSASNLGEAAPAVSSACLHPCKACPSPPLPAPVRNLEQSLMHLLKLPRSLLARPPHPHQPTTTQTHSFFDTLRLLVLCAHPLSPAAAAGDSDYRLPALLLCSLERGSGGVWVVEPGPDFLCLGADNKLYQVGRWGGVCLCRRWGGVGGCAAGSCMEG